MAHARHVEAQDRDRGYGSCGGSLLMRPRPLSESEASVLACVVGAIREQRLRDDAIKAMEQPRAIRPTMSVYVRGLGWVELKGRR